MAGMSGTRITMTIPPEMYRVLEMIAKQEYKTPGDMAKQIVFESLSILTEYVAKLEGSKDLTEGQAVRYMYKTALLKMAETLDEPTW